MDKFLTNIDRQIEYNKGKNLFRDSGETEFKFVDETIQAIAGIGVLDTESESFLIEYTADKVLNEFCRINQYYSFNTQAKEELKEIYRDLFTAFKTSGANLETISAKHYQNLQLWLEKNNAFARKMYSGAGEIIDPVACSEYSPQLQIDILGIKTESLMEPILDVGCGKKGLLVKYLSDQGFSIVGIDRFSFPESNRLTADWLEYEYGFGQWGTIISNLGFSNHFIHHNLRDDGNYLAYGKKYIEILKSLKVGGNFYYAPALPFIECYLDPEEFLVHTKKVAGLDYNSTIIKRIKSVRL